MDTYLDETWGYDHAVSNVASDTKVVCDWSNVQSDLDMPVCSKGTCPGHREDDLLRGPTKVFPEWSAKGIEVSHRSQGGK